MHDANIPSHEALQWPTIKALRELGGSASISELNTQAIAGEGFSTGQQNIIHGNGPQSELEYRLAWARTYLKNYGLVTNSARGVWALTEDGRKVSESDLGPLLKDFKQQSGGGKVPGGGINVTSGEILKEQRELDWQDRLLDHLMRLEPAAFERLAQRLLRESGFTNTTVTGRSGDGGIDGQGIYRISLLSFQVFFQCKRYTGSVGAGAVRDFRGAMAGRGNKGLLITTGSFTSEARKEATRDGATPIDLVDGTQLCLLLKERSLGVEVTTQLVEDVEIDFDFFDSLS